MSGQGVSGNRGPNAGEPGWSEDGYARTKQYDPKLEFIDEFMKSSDAEGVDPNELRSINIQEFYSHDDERRLMGTNYGSNKSVDAYNEWKKKRDAGGADHATFVDLVNKNPGRQGTILVPVSNTNDPTLLTGNVKKPKTVLG